MTLTDEDRRDLAAMLRFARDYATTPENIEQITAMLERIEPPAPQRGERWAAPNGAVSVLAVEDGWAWVCRDGDGPYTIEVGALTDRLVAA